MRYNNYHKHDHISNIYTPDTNAKMIDYVNRAIELGESNIWTTNHGSGGDIFEAKTLCNNNNLHCKFGMEGYIVPDPLDKTDKRNYHIVIIPTTNMSRKKLNLASSRANIEGYYYKPRLFLDDLLAFGKDELYITTACVAGLLKDEDSYNKLFMPLFEHFNDNLFVEVQSHNEDVQKSINERAIWCYENLGCKIIHGNDSHYIYPEQASERLELLKGKGINYGDEDSFMLDYPDYDKIVNRYKKQGVLSETQIKESLDNTLILDSVEDIEIDTGIKMPTIYPDLTEEEKYSILVDKVFEGFTKVMAEDNVDEDKQSQYIEECKKELQVINDTKEVCHTPDYFLLNTEVIKKASEYGGVLTRTGRGSCGSFLLNKMLGITQIDRLTVNLPMYSDRFMSTSRLLENKAMPDIDFNIVEQEPFVKATRDLLGENGCYPMIAYGTMKESEAFRNVCRSHNLEYELYNEVGKSLDNYRDNPQWKPYIEEANKYVGTIISASVHPCAHILLNGDIREELGIFKIGENLCCLITSGEADDWKYLKNDYLIVSVWKIISDTYKCLGQPIKTIKQLIDSIDDSVLALFNNGMTTTLNQVDGDWATKLLMEFKPKTVEELAMFVAAIRPGFAELRDDFISRKPYTNGSKYLDELFSNTYSRCCFQENLMKYFEWLSVTPAESIGLIKKISKKKIKQKDFDDLVGRLKAQWEVNTGSTNGFDESWEKIQKFMQYSFNSPHGLATALDCLYGAELKAHHPLEYYKTTLNIYKDDIEKTARLMEEMEIFGIKLESIKFRFSNDDYNMNKDTNTIYKSVSSIKNMGKSAGKELYALKDNQYPDFLSLLKDIKEHTSINSKQLDILVKLDFFREFGDINELLYIINVYTKFKDAKVLTKSNLTPYELEIATRLANKETAKQLRDFDATLLINELIANQHTQPVTNLERIGYDLGILGYTDITDETAPTNIFVCSAHDVNKYGSHFITIYDPRNGSYTQYKVKRSEYEANPCEAGDILRCIFETKPKRIKVDDEWVVSDEEETIIKMFSKPKNFLDK